MDKHTYFVDSDDEYNYYLVNSCHGAYGCNKCCFSISNQSNFYSCALARKFIFNSDKNCTSLALSIAREKHHISGDWYFTKEKKEIEEWSFKKHNTYNYILNNVTLKSNLWVNFNCEKTLKVSIICIKYNGEDIVVDFNIDSLDSNNKDCLIVSDNDKIYPFSFISEKDCNDNIDKIKEIKDEINNLKNKIFCPL